MKSLAAFFILVAALLLPSAYADAATQAPGLVSMSQELSTADGLRLKRELVGNVLTESECKVSTSVAGTTSLCSSQRVVLSKREAVRVHAEMVATSQALTLPMGSASSDKALRQDRDWAMAASRAMSSSATAQVAGLALAIQAQLSSTPSKLSVR